MGWSSVNLAEERQHQDVSTQKTQGVYPQNQGHPRTGDSQKQGHPKTRRAHHQGHPKSWDTWNRGTLKLGPPQN